MHELKKAIEDVLRSKDRFFDSDEPVAILVPRHKLDHLREVYEAIKGRL